jgi:hypothetical protein
MAKFLTYICALPHPKKSGRIPELLSADPSAIEAFARRWDKPGRGVYTCVSPLRAGSRMLPVSSLSIATLTFGP